MISLTENTVVHTILLHADPRGSGSSFIDYGKCPIDDNSWSDSELHTLALSKLFAFDYSNHGQFFWNFRTELEPRWSYLEATKNGWIPEGPFTKNTRSTFFKTCNALMNPPINCDDPVIYNGGLFGDLFKIVTSPSFLVLACMFIVVAALYSLKYIGGIGSKRKKNKINRSDYTTIPDEVNSDVIHEIEMRKTNVNDNPIQYNATRRGDAIEEMVIDCVVLSEKSGSSS